MSINYTKAVWTGNELITAADLNRIENGIADAAEEISNVAASAMPNEVVPIEKGGSAHTTAKGARIGFSAATAVTITDTPTWANIFAKLDEIPSGTTATIVTNSDNAAKLTNNNTYNLSGLRGFVTRSLDTDFYFTCEYGTTSPRILTWVISNFSSASSTPTVSTVTVFDNNNSIIPIEKGGTGYTTAKNARVGMDAATSLTIAPSSVPSWASVYEELDKIPSGETATILANYNAAIRLTGEAYNYALRGVVARSAAGGHTSFYFMCEVGSEQPRILIWALTNFDSASTTPDVSNITICGDTTNFVDKTTAANYVDKTKAEYYPSVSINFNSSSDSDTSWNIYSSLPTGRTINCVVTNTEALGKTGLSGTYFGSVIKPSDGILIFSLLSYGADKFAGIKLTNINVTAHTRTIAVNTSSLTAI